MAIDFENGIILPVKLVKSTKNIHEEINGKTIQDSIDIYMFELREGTARDMFISRCMEELPYLVHPEYGLRGSEFVAFATYPIGRAVRVFFSEPSNHHEDFHFFIMTIDHNDLLASLEGKNFELKIIPRDQEKEFGNV
jgi:hypothetical protein